MIYLSDLLNTSHSNIYVQLEKIKNSQQLAKELRTRQNKGGVIHIPPNVLNETIKELKRRQIAAENKIYTAEQLSFAFGS